MRVVLYWSVRTAVFLATYAVVWSLKWFDIFAVLFAFVIAWVVGYAAFPTLRRQAAEQMDGWINRGHRGIEADAVAEDARIDAGAPPLEQEPDRHE